MNEKLCYMIETDILRAEAYNEGDGIFSYEIWRKDSDEKIDYGASENVQQIMNRIAHVFEKLGSKV